MARSNKRSGGNGLYFLDTGKRVDVAQILDRSKDPVGNIVQMTYPHAAVHRDTIINASHYQDAGTGDLLFFIASGETLQMHLEYIVTAFAGARIRFYESPTVNAAGTVVPTVRLNRDTTKTTQAVITVGGTVTGSDFGTLLKDQYNGGGGTGAGTRGGSAVHDDAEWVLKLDTVYCLRITRTSSQIVGIEFEWYEVPQLPAAV